VVLLHGVCFGPETMAAAGARLSRRCRVLIPHRRGYGQSACLPPATSVDEQVADLLGVLDRAEIAQAVLAGVSGGATISLAAAIAHPGRVRALLVHEPALGPLAPGVHGLLSTAAGAVAQADDPATGAETMGRILAGPGWERQPPGVRRAVREAGVVVAAEVPGFIAWHPSPGDLAGLRGHSLLTSVGARSRAQRTAAAEVLARLAGARVQVIPDCAHLAQIDAPVAFARVVARLAGEAPA
jgi:pimeloyl-ACP methyl ester carboxylesterase